MDTHHPDDLSELERRLAACAPAADGLDADAMLFAAGRASARPGPARFVWPAVAAGMTALAVVLGVWLAAERTERLNLAWQLRQPHPAPVPTPAPVASSPEPSVVEEWSPESYLAARPALEKGLDAWPPRAVDSVPPPGPPPESPTLQVRGLDVLLAQ